MISNGHGEDEIAVRILKPLQQIDPVLSIMALPLVGVGQAYQCQGIPLLASGQNLPSGGFGGKDLLRDIQGGLLSLAGRQVWALKQWSTSGSVILAVGDVVPLLLAWMSGLAYAFVGTAKSEYWRTDGRMLWRFRASVYWPWERGLMAHARCCGVFPRDRTTTTHLQRWPIPVFDCGNPIMDDLELLKDVRPSQLPPGLKILLLPGSHAPEVYANWRLILLAIAGLIQDQQSYVFLGAIAPGIDLAPLQQILAEQRWLPVSAPVFVDNTSAYSQAHSHLLLVPKGFQDCLSVSEIVIAMAGTATEQAVGLGKPVITMPGLGPQFTRRFAMTQARLLGPSVSVLSDSQDLSTRVHRLQRQPKQQWMDNGQVRMGNAGAGKRIADCLQQHLL